MELPPLADQDYYYDGPYLVFTAAYHRKRGYCCGSGCRHCPYAGAGRGPGPEAGPQAETHQLEAPGED